MYFCGCALKCSLPITCIKPKASKINGVNSLCDVIVFLYGYDMWERVVCGNQT